MKVARFVGPPLFIGSTIPLGLVHNTVGEASADHDNKAHAAATAAIAFFVSSFFQLIFDSFDHTSNDIYFLD